MPGCTAQTPPPAPADTPGVIGVGVRLAVAGGLLTWGARLWGGHCVEELLPAFAALFSLLDEQFRIQLLQLGHQGADTVIRLQATLARPLFLNGQLFLPDPRGVATVTTTIGTILQAPIVCGALVLAWPARSNGERCRRLLGALPALTLLLAIDTPFILLASLWDLFLHSLEPGRFSLLLVWQQFLIGGGRLALAIALGVGVIALSRWHGGRTRVIDPVLE